MKEFRFYTESGIVRFSGRRANSVPRLFKGIQEVSGSSIFYHMHHALLRRHITPADAMNDFARWAWMHLGDQELGEQLAVVDPMECVSVREARERIAETVGPFIKRKSSLWKLPPEKEFFFLELQSFVFPMGLVARNRKEFHERLSEVGPGSIFYHFIESRIRLGSRSNDFSRWLAEELGEERLAAQIDSLSPYACTLWDLKQKILDLVGQRIVETGD